MPFIFTSVVNIVEETLSHNHGVDFLCHFLEDILTLEPPVSDVCLTNLATCLQLSFQLGIGRADHMLNNLGDLSTLWETPGMSPPRKLYSHHCFAKRSDRNVCLSAGRNIFLINFCLIVPFAFLYLFRYLVLSYYA